jgi:hypothetical protein
VDVPLQRVEIRARAVHEVLYETRFAPGGDVEHVVQHEDLAIRVGPRADADDRHVQRFRDGLPQLGGNTFEQHDVGAGRFERPGLVDHALRGHVVAALHPEAAGFVDRLRLEPQVRAHGDVVPCEELDDFELPEPALQFHHLRATFLHEAHGIGEGDLGSRVTGEWQVRDEKRTVQAARHRFAVIDDVVHGHGHRSVVTLQHHAQRIADQHQIGVGIVDQHGEARVVTGEARDLLAFALHAVERAERDRWSRRIALLEMRIHRLMTPRPWQGVRL